MWPLGFLISFAAYGVFAKQNCPLYGLGYPKPTNLLEQPDIKKAATDLDSMFSEHIDHSDQSKSGSFSYSIEVFSADDEESLWSHHWTSPNLKGLNSTGVTKVDGNTVYRIGSVTKVLTILTFLAEVGDSLWDEPIANYIPEIAALVVDGADNSHSISNTDWQSITLGSLASQMSGLQRDYALVGELTQGLTAAEVALYGFPIIGDEEIPPCGNNPVCNRTQFFDGLKRLPPSFSPYVTPAYSNIGFTLLGYVLEQITGRPFNEMLQDKVIEPLNLTRTFYSAPDDSIGIIPGDRYETSWAFDLGHESPTGNVYASPLDLAKVGRAILRSTLLPPTMTRRWLKPVVFSSDPKSGVGMPWGVRQLPLVADMPYQFATTFNKGGTLGKYSSLLAVIPDFNIGFSVLVAGDGLNGTALDLADMLSNVYLPTMVNIARTQANNVYGGTYRSPDSTINSTVSVVVDDQTPGLSLGSWISNGTDLAWLSVVLSQSIQEDYWEKVQPSVRLYPTGLWDAAPDGGKRVAFKAVFEDLSLPSFSNPFSTDCGTWVTGSGILYGSKPLDQFIFNVNAAGNVTSVENGALRNKLDKM